MSDGLGLSRSYSLLFVLACLLLATSWLVFPDQEWVSGFLSDFAAGIFGSLIIIFFVDQIIERNRQRERVKVAKIALKRVRFPILWHMILLCNVFKAATENKPIPLPSTYEDTFNDNYYEEIAFLDLTKEAPVALRMNWFNHLYSETRFFKEKLEQTLDTYAVYLDTEMIDALEGVINSPFLKDMTDLYLLPRIDRQFSVERPYTMQLVPKDHLKEHTNRMLKLIQYFNSKSDSPIEFVEGMWSDLSAPKWGSSRISR
jgi:hypothetical protein